MTSGLLIKKNDTGEIGFKVIVVAVLGRNTHGWREQSVEFQCA